MLRQRRLDVRRWWVDNELVGSVSYMEVIGVLVVPLVFKTNVGLNKVPGGFDSHSPPVDESGDPKSLRSPLLF